MRLFEGVNQQRLLPVRQEFQVDAQAFFYYFVGLLQEIVFKLQPPNVATKRFDLPLKLHSFWLRRHRQFFLAFHGCSNLRAGELVLVRTSTCAIYVRRRQPMPVPLNAETVALISKQVGKHLSHVFSYRGRPIAQVSTKAWYAALERTGIADFRWHDLRHTWASWHVQKVVFVKLCKMVVKV